MKKILISLVLLVPLLSGCANVDTRININKDYSASVVTSLTYQGDLSDSTDAVADTISSVYSSYLDPLYNVEKAYGAKLSTITADKNVKNLKYEDLDLSSLGFVSNLPSKKFIELKKNFLVTSINIDATYDYKSQADKFSELPKSSEDNQSKVADGLQPEYFQKYADPSEFENSAPSEFDFSANIDDATKQFLEEQTAENSAVNKSSETNNQSVSKNNSDFTTSFSIKVPGLASYNNADSFDGDAYIWNIKKDGKTVIKLQYVHYSGWAISFVILIGILLLVLLSRKIIKRDSLKRIDNIDNIV